MFILFCFMSLLVTGRQTDSSLLPLFTLFNWTSNSGPGYIAKGQLCQTVIVGSIEIPIPCSPASLVVDPQNKRWALDGGYPTGTFIALENKAYIFNTSTLSGDCSVVSGWNYSVLVDGYAQISSLPGSKFPGNSEYFGTANDIAACNTPLAALLKLDNYVIYEFDFSQYYPVPLGPNGSFICGIAQGSFQFDMNACDRTSDRSKYF